MIHDLCHQIAVLANNGWKPVLITSGAVASGRGFFTTHSYLEKMGNGGQPRKGEEEKSKDCHRLLRGTYAAVGQSRLQL